MFVIHITCMQIGLYLFTLLNWFWQTQEQYINCLFSFYPYLSKKQTWTCASYMQELSKTRFFSAITAKVNIIKTNAKFQLHIQPIIQIPGSSPVITNIRTRIAWIFKIIGKCMSYSETTFSLLTNFNPNPVEYFEFNSRLICTVNPVSKTDFIVCRQTRNVSQTKWLGYRQISDTEQQKSVKSSQVASSDSER